MKLNAELTCRAAIHAVTLLGSESRPTGSRHFIWVGFRAPSRLGERPPLPRWIVHDREEASHARGGLWGLDVEGVDG